VFSDLRSPPTEGLAAEVPMWVARDGSHGSGLACDGQLLRVPPGTYEWLYLLMSWQYKDTQDAGAHEVWLHYRDRAQPEWLHRGDHDGRVPTVVRVPVPRSEPLVALRLPEDTALRLHAVALAEHPPADAGRSGRLVELAPHMNSVGIEPTERPGNGAFNIWHNTFPIEELPRPGSTPVVGGVRFRFPLADGVRPDNIRCRGQSIELPVDRADWLHFLAAAERRTEDELTVHYADGTARSQWLRVSDFWPETEPWFGELLAFRTSAMLYPNHVDARMPPSIWRQRVPVAVPDGVVAVTLPDNPAIHIFALTVDDGVS
jgi:hypothetical protein